MSATRREVAEAANVSMRTVSNVANGYTHVSAETRARVLRAIDELDYRPSEVARSLRSGRSGMIALILPGVATPYFAELVQAFVEEGASRGIRVMIDETNGDPGRERELILRSTQGSLFDAIILSPLGLRPNELAGVSPDLPLVFLGEDAHPGFDQVMIDNYAASRDAIAHLAAKGRRRIAVIGAETSEYSSSSQRLAGYLDAMRDLGLTPDPGFVQYVASFGREEGAAAMRRLLDLDTQPDGVFCFSDTLALGALRVLNQQAVHIPDQIAVVGFDDVEDGRYSTPTLTSISPDKEWIARTTLDLVANRLDGEAAEPRVHYAPYMLRQGESS